MLDVQISLQRTEGFRLRSDFRLERPVNGVFGPSGAGKTTLLHLIAGLEKSAEGSIRLQGHTLQDAARGVFIPAHKRRIGVVFQDARLFPHLSVMGNLRFALKRVRKHGRVPHVSSDDVIHLLELEPLLTRRPADLSGGEQRRVALARALLSAPRLLLLDEPLSGLHVALRREILGYLKAIQ
ncbi:MAG: ATP-binding cassette domain-containing protein, partial [Candidatus Sumerlaeota bacterium]